MKVRRLPNFSAFIKRVTGRSGVVTVALMQKPGEIGGQATYTVTLEAYGIEFESFKETVEAPGDFGEKALNKAEEAFQKLAKKRIKSEIQIYNPANQDKEFIVSVPFYGLPAYTIDKLVGNREYGQTREEVVEGVLERFIFEELENGSKLSKFANLSLTEAKEEGFLEGKTKLVRKSTIPDKRKEFDIYIHLHGISAYAIPRLYDCGLFGLSQGAVIEELFNRRWLLEHLVGNIINPEFGEELSLLGLSVEEAKNLGYVPIKLRKWSWKNAN